MYIMKRIMKQLMAMLLAISVVLSIETISKHTSAATVY
jgi:hypothetical protein